MTKLTGIFCSHVWKKEGLGVCGVAGLGKLLQGDSKC